MSRKNKGQHEEIEMSIFYRGTRGLLAGSAILLVTACDQPLDLDLRGKFGNALSTSAAAQQATAKRPRPDNRGIISYPNYQVAVAKRGDTLASVATRIGADADALARYNGIATTDVLRAGEVVALPRRVAEPSPETGSATTGPIQAPNVDIASLAGGAIDRAGAQTVETTALSPTKPATQARLAKVQTGLEPTRHKVVRGETAYTISRLYNVSVRSLAEWNGLDSKFAIREGQYLLIPVANVAAPKAAKNNTTAPGAGSQTPTPPSATKPLPREAAKTAAATATATAPNLGKTQSKPTRTGQFAYPVNGKIIREYSKGKNDGIDISASAGTAIRAAEAGTIAAITSDADQVPIIVVKHPKNILTVYANVSSITVKKGDSVKRGQALAKIRSGKSAYVHFEVRKGFNSVDPLPYLQ